MSKFEFVSHDEFPEDEYTKEAVYLCLEDKYRVGYVRRKAQNGGLFWSVMSAGVMKNGKKEFLPAFIQDSNFLEKDIKDFLEKRKWENSVNRHSVLPSSPKPAAYAPASMSEVAETDEIPF